MEALIYAANGLDILAYFVQDMLRLRLLTIAGAVCPCVYFATLPTPLMHVVYWNLFYVALNGVQITRLLLAGRPAQRPRVAAGGEGL